MNNHGVSEYRRSFFEARPPKGPSGGLLVFCLRKRTDDGYNPAVWSRGAAAMRRVIENHNVKVLSISVGLPRDVAWKGKTVSTAIFKEPVSGPVLIRKHNLDGDRQADLSVHGGPTKAVYVYPSENFTTEGLSEESVHIGDVFQLGTARLIVTEPRMPCFKLNIRIGRDDRATSGTGSTRNEEVSRWKSDTRLSFSIKGS